MSLRRMSLRHGPDPIAVYLVLILGGSFSIIVGFSLRARPDPAAFKFDHSNQVGPITSNQHGG